jgi:hypothetical protein
LKRYGRDKHSQLKMAAVTLPKVHLIVFIHGLDGTGNDFDNLEHLFLRHFNPDHPIETLKIMANSRFAQTYDGIESGSIRIWKEIMLKIDFLNPNVKWISFVGHSLGGLYARYVVKLLDDCEIFHRIQPMYFVTLATPHLSVRRPQTRPFNMIFQRLAQVVSKTTKELCLEDDIQSPLLYRMGTDDYFVNTLKKFQKRVLYSNISNDFQVFYSTSSISTFNPYNVDVEARLQRSYKYPDLTAWSLAKVQDRLMLDEDLSETFAAKDEKSHFLKQMYRRLNSLGWERYDALFSTVFAHEQIICKRGSMFAGKHVLKHLIHDVFALPEQPRRSYEAPRYLTIFREMRNKSGNNNNGGEGGNESSQSGNDLLGTGSSSTAGAGSTTARLSANAPHIQQLSQI